MNLTAREEKFVYSHQMLRLINQKLQTITDEQEKILYIEAKIEVLTSLKYYEEATKLIEKCLKNDPQNCEFNFEKGLILELTGKISKALNIYDWLIQKYPSYVSSYYSRAVVMFHYYDKKKEALEFVDNAINFCQDDANMLYYAKGYFFKKLKRYNDAIEAFNMAIQIDPQIVKYYKVKAQCYLKLKKYKLCLQELIKALNLEPTDKIMIRLKKKVMIIFKKKEKNRRTKHFKYFN
jgi:tetratricopeptide (TPR) repeat protein